MQRPFLEEQLLSDTMPGAREAKLASAALGFFAALGLMYALESIEGDDDEPAQPPRPAGYSGGTLGESS